MRFLIKPGGVAPKRAHDNDAGLTADGRFDYNCF
jgi:hypothetical protein